MGCFLPLLCLVSWKLPWRIYSCLPYTVNAHCNFCELTPKLFSIMLHIGACSSKGFSLSLFACSCCLLDISLVIQLTVVLVVRSSKICTFRSSSDGMAVSVCHCLSLGKGQPRDVVCQLLSLVRHSPGIRPIHCSWVLAIFGSPPSLHLVPLLTGKGRWCCDVARAGFRQNWIVYPSGGMVTIEK